MKTIIKIYLEDACKTDPALCGKYNAKEMDKCVDYIVKQAKDYLKGHNGAVADAIVYKWARDFFLDGETERQDNVTEEQEVQEAIEAQKKMQEAPAKKKLGDLEQLDIFSLMGA